jgi:hypothetical protein
MPPEVRNMSTLPKTPKLSLSDALLRFHPLVFFASYKSGKFENEGLRGRRLGPGRYRFVRSDGSPMKSHISTIVRIDDPWARERAMMAVLACPKHGLACCPEMDLRIRPCKKGYVLVEGSRWMARVDIEDERIDVNILRYPKARTVAGALRRKATFQDAGFAIQVMTGKSTTPP